MALKEFSRRVRRAIRACDVAVRLGGDEFLVILPECPRDKIDAILARIGDPAIDHNGEKILIGYSVGRAQHQYNDTPAALLARADDVLYVQKAARPLKFTSPRQTGETISSSLRSRLFQEMTCE